MIQGEIEGFSLVGCRTCLQKLKSPKIYGGVRKHADESHGQASICCAEASSGVHLFCCTISSVGLLRNFIAVVIGISIIVGFIVVSMAMYTAVLERTREIGILRSLGASSQLILSLLLRESLLLALAGTAIGIGLTYLAQWTMANVVHSGLTQETVYFWWPIAGAIAITGALLGTVAPAVKAIRQDVTEALSYE